MTSRVMPASICGCRRWAGLYAWEFEREGRPLNVRVEGQFTTNSVPLILDAARAGLGLSACPATRSSGWWQRRARPGAGRLVPALSRLPSLLSKPAACRPCLCPAVEALRHRG